MASVRNTTNDRQSLLEYQHLGRRCSTQPFVNAMVAILLSPYRPRAITAVFREVPCHGDGNRRRN